MLKTNFKASITFTAKTLVIITLLYQIILHKNVLQGEVNDIYTRHLRRGN